MLYYKNKYCTPTLRKYSKYEPFVYLQSSNILVENIWGNVERHISLQILKTFPDGKLQIRKDKRIFGRSIRLLLEH